MNQATLRTLAAGVLLAACATGRTHAADASAPTTVMTVPVVVTNYGFTDADIYAVHLSSRVRLGFVPAQSHGTLTIPASMVDNEQIQLSVHQVGGPGDYTTDIVIVPSDEHAVLDLQNELEESSLAVFPDKTK